MSKTIKYLILMILSIVILTSCWEEEAKKEVNIEKIEKNTTVEKEKLDEEKIVENNKPAKKMKSDEQIEKEILKSYSKRVSEPKKANQLLFNNWLQKCSKDENPDTCKKIFISREARKQKDINLCSFLKDEKQVQKCKYKVVLNLVWRELNSKYCSELDEEFKEECLEEYKNSLKREIENVKEFEKINSEI